MSIYVVPESTVRNALERQETGCIYGHGMVIFLHPKEIHDLLNFFWSFGTFNKVF
jgi:hypothetical protein